MTTLVDRVFLSLAARTLKVTASDCACGGVRRGVCARRAAASIGQRTVKRARLRGWAAPLAEGFNPNRDPSRPLRKSHNVPAADRAARLVDRSA